MILLFCIHHLFSRADSEGGRRTDFVQEGLECASDRPAIATDIEIHTFSSLYRNGSDFGLRTLPISVNNHYFEQSNIVIVIVMRRDAQVSQSAMHCFESPAILLNDDHK
jgi:hypothetical protein